MTSGAPIKILVLCLFLSPLFSPTNSIAFPNILTSLYKKQADTFVDQALPEIIETWSVARLTKYAHPYLFRQTPRDDIERLFFFFQSLGPLQKYHGSQGEITLTVNSTGEQIITGNYTAHATFQNGNATIQVAIIREDEKWSISNFVVNSEAFQKKTAQDTGPKDKKLSETELEQKVAEILSQNTIQKRRNVEFVFQLAKIYREEGKINKAIPLYEKGLQVDSSDLNKQFLLAKLLLKNNRRNDAIPILQNIFEFSEDWPLCQQSRNLLTKLHAEIPDTAPQKKIAYNKVKVLLVPIGNPHKQLLLELRSALQNELGIQVSIAKESINPGKFDIRLSDKYTADIFKKITKSLTELQYNEITNKLNISKDDLHSSLPQSRFILSYLDKLGAEGIASRQQFENNLKKLSKSGQYYTETLTKKIRQRFPFGLDEPIQSYIGVTAEDIGCHGCNFLYGKTIGIYGAISYYRFTAKFNGESDNRPRLVKRLLKQALSSINFTFGIPRCNTPYCARAFPNNLQEHDAKSEHLCRICKARLETFKKHPVSDTMASEYSYLGERYLDKKKWGPAVEAFQKALVNDPDLGPAFEGLGIALANMNKFTEAIKAYKKAIAEYEKSAKINPGKVYENLGIALQNAGQKNKAFSAYIKAESLTAVSDFTNISLGDHYLSEQQYHKALKEFLAARKQNPANKEAGYGIGIAYVHLGKHQKAIPYLEEIQSAYSDNGEFYSLLGSCYHETGKKDQAIHCYRKAIQLNPKLPTVHYNFGLLLEQQDPAAAVDQFQKATKLDPSYVDAYTQLGITYGKLGRLYKSIGSLRAALSLSPNDANIHNSLGYSYYLQKKYNRAIQQYDQAIHLKPKFALAHYNKAIAHYALEEFDSAIKHFDIAKKLHYPCSKKFEAALAIHRLDMTKQSQ